jgi:multiple sugar transport system ATP-binding protein
VNLFVATFIGSPPMSTLPAIVRDGIARWAGGSFTLGRAADDVTIGVRPEHVHVRGSRWSASSVPVDRFSARVELVESLGDQNLLDLEVEGVRLRARVEPGFRPARDERVSCWFEPSAVHVFDIDTGDALR